MGSKACIFFEKLICDESSFDFAISSNEGLNSVSLTVHSIVWLNSTNSWNNWIKIIISLPQHILLHSLYMHIHALYMNYIWMQHINAQFNLAIFMLIVSEFLILIYIEIILSISLVIKFILPRLYIYVYIDYII